MFKLWVPRLHLHACTRSFASASGARHSASASDAMKPCKGCGSVTRKVTAPGPRCASCHREAKKASRRASHGRWILKTYGLTIEQYEALYEAQGGVCFICQRATGKTRRLAVDHDHKTGYVRGLLCKPCNSVLAHFRDDTDTVLRVGSYLRWPPAFSAIGKVKPDGGEELLQ